MQSSQAQQLKKVNGGSDWRNLAACAAHRRRPTASLPVLYKGCQIQTLRLFFLLFFCCLVRSDGTVAKVPRGDLQSW
jgi:hypothetical protein